MGSFGVPVTTETLSAMSTYRRHKRITQEDKAREAMKLIHAEDKNIEALQSVQRLKSEHGKGVSTMVLIYNATGERLDLVEEQRQDWRGGVAGEEPPCKFENGQWLAFLHAHPTAQAYGSEGARVYRCTNMKGQVRDFLVAWSVPWGKAQNSAYTQVGEKDYFQAHWNDMKRNLETTGKTVIHKADDSFTSSISIGGLTTSECIAILQHKFSPLPDEMS